MTSNSSTITFSKALIIGSTHLCISMFLNLCVNRSYIDLISSISIGYFLSFSLSCVSVMSLNSFYANI